MEWSEKGSRESRAVLLDVAENKDLGALLVRKQLQRAQITLGMDEERILP